MHWNLKGDKLNLKIAFKATKHPQDFTIDSAIYLIIPYEDVPFEENGTLM